MSVVRDEASHCLQGRLPSFSKHFEEFGGLLTSRDTQSWLAPQQEQWPPGHQRCVSARSPSANPRSSPPQRSNCPVKNTGHTAASLYCEYTDSFKNREGWFPGGLKLQRKLHYNEMLLLTGPTNPKSPDRTNGISPMGTPLALTGITWTRPQGDKDIYHRKKEREKLSYSMRLYQHRQTVGDTLLSYLKGVFGDSRQPIVHVASSSGVYYYLSYLVCFTQLRRPVRLNNAHQSWRHTKVAFWKCALYDLKVTVLSTSCSSRSQRSTEH